MRRRRRVLAAGVALAVIAVVATGFRITPGLPPKLEGRQYEVGVAAVQVLVDSPQSQVVDVGGVDTGLDGVAIDLASLSTRARLLGSLMAVSPSRERIAHAAGVRPERLIVLAPARQDGAPRTATATGVSVEIGERGASTIDLSIDETLPIITVRVQAPDARTAERLATGTVAELGRRVAADAAATADPIPDMRRVIVDTLGSPTSATVVRGPRRLFSLVAGLFVLGLWCAAMQLAPRTLSAWRREARLEASVQT